MAGNIKREIIKNDTQNENEQEVRSSTKENLFIVQNCVLFRLVIQAIMDSFVPRLVADDLVLLNSLLNDVFPNATYNRPPMTRLREEIENVAKEMYLVCDQLWVEESFTIISNNKS